MAELLLHKQEIPKDTLDRLAAEGVIAIQTDDPEGFRFLTIEPATISTSDFLWASLDALREAVSGGRGASQLVENLARLASEAREKKQEDR